MNRDRDQSSSATVSRRRASLVTRFITFGTVDDSIDRFTMRVSTDPGVPMFALSNVVGSTSMSGKNVLVPFITRLLTSSLGASVKSHNGSSMTQSLGSNTNGWLRLRNVARLEQISTILAMKKVTKDSANTAGLNPYADG